MKVLETFFSQEEIRKIRHSWPLFKVTIKQQAQVFESPLEFYQYFFKSPYYEKHFSPLRSLFQFFLCIGVSTASVERLFSILNLVKIARRSRLGQSILNELILIRFNTGPPGHLDEKIRERAVCQFFSVKKRRTQQTRLSTVKLNCPLEVSKNKKRKRIH